MAFSRITARSATAGTESDESLMSYFVLGHLVRSITSNCIVSINLTEMRPLGGRRGGGGRLRRWWWPEVVRQVGPLVGRDSREGSVGRGARGGRGGRRVLWWIHDESEIGCLY